VSNVEHPKYTLVERSGAIEIRDYAPMIVAETEVTGERREAITKGFRLIADYIFGNNTAAQKVPMTTPVTQQGDGNTWRVRFIMPSKYTIETLPKPNNGANGHLDASSPRSRCSCPRTPSTALPKLTEPGVLSSLANVIGGSGQKALVSRFGWAQTDPQQIC